MTPEQVAEHNQRVLTAIADCKRAYMLTFNTEHGKAVFEVDLAKYCRANENAAVPGDRDRTWLLIGRREVYLYIRDYLDLTPEQLVEKYTTPAPQS